MPNRISVGPDGLLALTMPRQTDGLYDPLPRAGQIWLVDPQTGRVHTVLAEGENLSWATFSPDGNELLYVQGPSVDPHQILVGEISHPWRLMLFDRRDNTHTELLSGDRGFIWAPTFSPDGRKIAYYRGDGESHLGLYVFNRDAHTEQLVKLMQDGASLFYAPYGPGPLWTPDGQSIFAFRVEQILPEETLPSPHEITSETVRVFAGRLVMISVSCGCESHVLRGFFPLLPVPLFLVASADGQKLYVNGYDQTFSVDPRERVNLYEITLETGEQTTLYDHGGIVVAPAPSPDGQRLLFTVIAPEEPLKADLYLLDLTSAAPARKLTDDGRSGFGLWLSQDEIGFLRLSKPQDLRGEIWVGDLTTTEERNLSALLAVQGPLAQLSQEIRSYEKSLEQLERRLAALDDAIGALSEAVTALSARLDAAQTQSLEISNKITQKIDELMADISVVKTQLSGIESDVKALSARPGLSLWELVIALLIAVVVMVWLIRRALHSLAQQMAFPPQ